MFIYSITYHFFATLLLNSLTVLRRLKLWSVVNFLVWLWCTIFAEFEPEHNFPATWDYYQLCYLSVLPPIMLNSLVWLLVSCLVWLICSDVTMFPDLSNRLREHNVITDGNDEQYYENTIQIVIIQNSSLSLLIYILMLHYNKEMDHI